MSEIYFPEKMLICTASASWEAFRAGVCLALLRSDIWRLRADIFTIAIMLRYTARNAETLHCAKLETLCCGRWWNMWQNRWRHDTNPTPLNRHLIKYANIKFKIRSSRRLVRGTRFINPIIKQSISIIWSLSSRNYSLHNFCPQKLLWYSVCAQKWAFKI